MFKNTPLSAFLQCDVLQIPVRCKMWVPVCRLPAYSCRVYNYYGPTIFAGGPQPTTGLRSAW